MAKSLEELRQIAEEKIDLHSLDQILVEHPALLATATDGLPDARARLSAAKMSLERVRSNAFILYREQLAKDGGRVTDKATEAMVITDDEVIKAQGEVVEAQRNYDQHNLLREIYLQREFAIKALIDLYKAQYWTLHGVK